MATRWSVALLRTQKQSPCRVPCPKLRASTGSTERLSRVTMRSDRVVGLYGNKTHANLRSSPT